jgi:hypothetical protein
VYSFLVLARKFRFLSLSSLSDVAVPPRTLNGTLELQALILDERSVPVGPDRPTFIFFQLVLNTTANPSNQGMVSALQSSDISATSTGVLLAAREEAATGTFRAAAIGPCAGGLQGVALGDCPRRFVREESIQVAVLIETFDAFGRQSDPQRMNYAFRGSAEPPFAPPRFFRPLAVFSLPETRNVPLSLLDLTVSPGREQLDFVYFVYAYAVSLPASVTSVEVRPAEPLLHPAKGSYLPERSSAGAYSCESL